MDSEVMTVMQASKRLKISRALAYQLCRENRLPGAIRLGAKRIIISRVQFERWLNGDGDSEVYNGSKNRG